MTHLSKKGRCDGGPWAGQEITAEPVVNVIHLGSALSGNGCYRYDAGAWIYDPGTMTAQVDNEATVHRDPASAFTDLGL